MPASSPAPVPELDVPELAVAMPSVSGIWLRARTAPCPPTRTDESAVIREQSVFGATLARVLESEALVQRCQAGDPDAFRELFRNHQRDVARLVQRLLGSRADVEDVVQDVFLQVHRSLKDFRFGARFSTWLYRVTVNVVLMHRRAARSRPLLVDAEDGPPPCDEALPPDEQAARRRRVLALYRLLDRLSDKKRFVYVLHEIEGLSPSEIAELVGAPVLTVRTRLFYARRELVRMLREEPALAHVADTLGSSADLLAPPHKEPA